MKYLAFAVAIALFPLAGNVVYSNDSNNLDAAAQSSASSNVKFITKLSGLVLFAADSCPEIRVDYDRFKEVSTRLGVEVEALSKDPIRLDSLSYVTSYKEDVKENCTRALTEFGPSGRILRGIFDSNS